MSRRRSGITSFFDGFNQGYQTVGRVMQDRELRRIATEAPIESRGYTADQGEELRRAAESGQYDIGIKTKEDGTFDSYTVTPKADPTKSANIAMQGVTDFLGERRAGSMTDGQVDRARTMAQAGVLAKFGDPLEAQKLRQQAAQSEQLEKQGVLTDLQIGRARRDEETQTKLSEVNDALSNYMKSRVRLGEDGQPMPLTDDDFVMAGKQRVFELANRGLFDQATAAARESMDYATRKIQAETVERQAAVRDAVARIAQGDYAQAMAAFNKYVPDGNIVQNVTQNRDGSFTLERVSGVDGAKLPPVKVESLDKLVAAVQSIADPNALTQQIERTFRNDIETRRLKLSENADRRSGAQFAQGQADRAQTREEAEAKATAAVNLYQERNPNATPAQLEAVRRGILEPVPKADGSAPADVKLAQAALAAGVPGVTDMASALQWARGKSETTPQEMHREFVNAALKNMSKPEDAVADADAVMKTMGFVKQGNRWTSPTAAPQAGGGSPAAGAAAQGLPKVSTPEELAKLPKGSRYVAPDGSVRIRQ